MRRHLRASIVAVLMCTVPSIATADASAMIVLVPPVDAPVLDPFRLPAGPYGPGNRGIEYGTELGDPVRAAAGGVVVFAGAVAGSLHVTVDHGGGLLSSYSFVDRVLVAAGQPVARGERVAVAGPAFHFGVRVDGRYVDPASLMGQMVVRVRLIRSRPELGVVARSRAVADEQVRTPVGSASFGVGVPRARTWYRRLVG
jgi:murein DD-endopeptidase MepM/ murein hydrolase activator NlpD